MNERAITVRNIPRDFLVEYDGMRPDLIDAVDPIVRRCMPIVCSTFIRLCIRFDHELEVAGENKMSDRYGFSFITIGAEFLNLPDRERAEVIVHELVHLSTGHLTQWMRRTLAEITEGPTQKLIQSKLADREEPIIESMARGLTRLLFPEFFEEVGSPEQNAIKALEALGAMPEGYCFCRGRQRRDATKPEHRHTGECQEARAAIAASRS